MPRFFLAIVFLLTSYTLKAQCNDWEALLGYKDVFIKDIARDRFGNLYAVGNFFSPDFKIGTTDIPLRGIHTLFIAKFDKDMSLAWAKSVGGTSQEFAENVVVDKDDNIIVAGYFYSPSISFDCIQLTKSSRSEMYIVKYSADGYAQWALGTSGLNDGFFSNLAITEDNHIVLSSSFVDGSVQFGGENIEGFGGYDSFISLLNSSGTIEWIRSFGGKNSLNPDYITALDVDASNNIIFTGLFESPSIAFDNFNVNAFTLSENYFVAKLSNLGQIVWANGGASPVNHSGMALVVNEQDEIFVGGRFYGNTVNFGSFTLSSQGDADMFVVRYDPNGSVMNARSFGGSGFDTVQELEVNGQGKIVTAGMFYSNSFVADLFTLTKPEFQSDVVIMTLDDQEKVECFNRTSGDAENYVGAIRIDDAGNSLIIMNSILGGTTHFDGGISFDDSQTTSMLVSLGDDQDFDTPTANPIQTLHVNLGNDIVKCIPDEIILDAGYACNTQYLWNDGSTDSQLKTTYAGNYWVQVTSGGKIGRDTILVENVPMPALNLGDDRELCPGNSISIDGSQGQHVNYMWENGSTIPTRTINAPGTYRLEITNGCGTAASTLTVTGPPPLTLDLKEDQVLCAGETVTLKANLSGDFQYVWQDGSHVPELTVTQSGTYTLSVSNQCESVEDSVKVLVIDVQNMVIPNVITPNGDTRNDSFMLPEELAGSSITIFNRWGSKVFQAIEYQNNWTAEGLAPGVYFYQVEGSCATFKGIVHVLE